MARWRAENPPPPPAPDKDYSLALTEARRLLDTQLALVDASRGRTISLLGVGGLLGTFVGGLDSRQPGGAMTTALWVAASAFGVAVVVGLLILYPWKFRGGMKAATIVGWVEQGETRSVMERDLALRTEEQHAENARKADALQGGLIVVVLALAVEFVSLAYQLRSA
jgi:hypothetical protein